MNKKHEFFLPMTDKAINSFLYHLDVEMVKPMFGLLEKRKNDTLKEEDIFLLYPELIDEERNYRFYLTNMTKEIEQLFYLTSPYFQEKIRDHLKAVLKILESEIERECVIKSIKSNNETVTLIYPAADGSYETIEQEREKSEQFNLKLLSSPYFEEYLTILDSMLQYFRGALIVFVTRPTIVIKTNGNDLPKSIYVKRKPKFHGDIITEWEKFIGFCDKYSQPVINEKDGKEYKFISSKIIQGSTEKKYNWHKIGKSPLPSLGQFIKRLNAIGLVNFDCGDKKDITQGFFEHFNIPLDDERQKNLGKYMERKKPYLWDLFCQGMKK